jgi:hypothetical protein
MSSSVMEGKRPSGFAVSRSDFGGSKAAFRISVQEGQVVFVATAGHGVVFVVVVVH